MNLEFVLKILPEVVDLVRNLYDAFDGDADEVRRNIRDRSAEIASNRAKVDRMLDEKHGKE